MQIGDNKGGEMIVSSDHIREQIARLWPGLRYIVLSDPAWMLPAIDEVRAHPALALETPFVDHVFECEEIALEFVVEARRRQALGKPSAQDWQRYNWPLGFVIGTRFRGRAVNHFCNIVSAREGLYLIERQTGDIWQPHAERDHIYFLFM